VTYGKPLTPEELGLLEGKGSEFREASRMIMEKIAEIREADVKAFEK
jgi:1-acyl-sn-glycerol-3-phosphate acyltransferase